MLSVGPFTLAKNAKSKKPGFFVVPFTLAQKNPITFGFFGTKSACAKNPESHTCVLVSGAHARLLRLQCMHWARTRMHECARISIHVSKSRASGSIPLKVPTYHVTKNPDLSQLPFTPANFDWSLAFTLAKKTWKTPAWYFSKNPTPRVVRCSC